jgi:DNA-binding MarR family transcriptional regulator
MSEPRLQPVATPDPQAVFAIGNLVAVVRRLADDLEETARLLHHGDNLTVAERRLLLQLRQGGPQAIPQLARKREATRQYIQQTLAPLVARGLVAWQDNPRHRRSRLAVLTEEGAGMTRRVMQREGELVRRLAAGTDLKRITATVETLKELDDQLRAANRPPLPPAPTQPAGPSSSSSGS